MFSGELVNYAMYGSLTREVAEILLNRTIQFAPARIPDHGIRYLTHNIMSDAEREVMQGSSRFIAVPDYRYSRGIKGGIIFGLPQEEVSILEFFDNTSPTEYEVKKHEVVALQGLRGDIESKLPAVLVARKKVGRNIGQWRDPMKYDPYEPFALGSIGALAAAEEVREIYSKIPK